MTFRDCSWQEAVEAPDRCRDERANCSEAQRCIWTAEIGAVGLRKESWRRKERRSNALQTPAAIAVSRPEDAENEKTGERETLQRAGFRNDPQRDVVAASKAAGQIVAAVADEERLSAETHDAVLRDPGKSAEDRVD